MRAKIRLKIKRSEKTKKSERKKRDIGTLNKKDVKDEFIKNVTANVHTRYPEEMEDINEI